MTARAAEGSAAPAKRDACGPTTVHASGECRGHVSLPLYRTALACWPQVATPEKERHSAYPGVGPQADLQATLTKGHALLG